MIERIGLAARWSDAVVVGNLIFLAGHTAETTRGQPVRLQTEDVLASLDDTLAQAGVSKEISSASPSISPTFRGLTR